MNWEKSKRIEQSRMRSAIERREVKRDVTLGELVGYIIITVSLTIVAYCVCKAFEPNEEQIREEIEREEAERVTEVRMLKDEILRDAARAAEIVKRDPNNGLARFVLLAGWKLYNAEVI